MKEYRITSSLHEFLQKDFQNFEIKTDNELCMYDYFINWLENGKKTTTIRYAKGKIRIPHCSILHLIETKQNDIQYKKYAGHITIDNLVVKTVTELTEDDAVREGFNNKGELIRTLKKIYGEIVSDELVSIYSIKLT